MENRTGNSKKNPEINFQEAEAFVRLMRSISGKWKLSILWSLQNGKLRFGEIHRAIPGVSRNMLSHQLRELEDCGFVKRTVFPEIPPRVEYELTEASRDLQGLLDAFQLWHQKHEALQIRKRRAKTDTDDR